MKIYFADEKKIDPDVIRGMEEAAALAVTKEGLDPERCELSVSFVSDRKIKKLNAEYRGVDKVTDVLSFPQYDDLNELTEEMEICLGDVVICEKKARQQAVEFGHSYEREILYLFTHSVLHLLGYDHEEEADKQEMRAREEEIMNELGLPQPGGEVAETAGEGPETAGEAPEEEYCTDRDLYQIAREALKNAYAPFSKYQVGAALLAKDGRIFTGCNVENSTYGATICAEHTACVKAVSEGCREFEALAVAIEGGTATPCGICRQFLYEFAPDLRVITGPDEDHLKSTPLYELLPEGFRL